MIDAYALEEMDFGSVFVTYSEVLETVVLLGTLPRSWQREASIGLVIDLSGPLRAELARRADLAEDARPWAGEG